VVDAVAPVQVVDVAVVDAVPEADVVRAVVVELSMPKLVRLPEPISVPTGCLWSNRRMAASRLTT